MAERLLFVPGFGRAPGACEALGGYRGLLAEFRSLFEVEIFSWPTVEAQPRFPSTWQGCVAALQDALSPDCHLVVGSGNASIALMALSGDRIAARTFACDGLQVPFATLNALGMTGLADAAKAAALLDISSYAQGALAMTEGATDEELKDDSEALGRYRSTSVDRFMHSWLDLDLTKECQPISLPTLYLDPDIDMPGYSEMQDVFLLFAPGARLGRLEGWPRRQQEDEAGRAFARKVLTFIKGVAERAQLKTVLISDIIDSTIRAVELGDRAWALLLDAHNAAVRRELDRHAGHEVDTAGDGFLATFESPVKAVRCAVGIVEAVSGLGLDVRAGVHTGEVEVVGDKVRGAAVHAAARVAAKAQAGEVLVSEAVRQLLIGSDIKLEERGEHELKGLPGKWRLFAVNHD
jgi:class 3 adenylate cyclase